MTMGHLKLQGAGSIDSNPTVISNPPELTAAKPACARRSRSMSVQLMRRSSELTELLRSMELKEIVATLRLVPSMAILDEIDLVHLAQTAEKKVFACGASVAIQGDPGHALFILTTGRCSVSHGAQVVSWLDAPSYFGEIALFEPGARRQESVHVGPECAQAELLEITGVQYRACLERVQRAKHDCRVRLLPSVAIFSHWAAETLHALAHRVILETKEDAIVATAGSAADAMYLLVEGKVELSLQVANGVTSRRTATVTSPGVFGALALVMGRKNYIFDSRAVGAVTVLRLSRADFNTMVSGNSTEESERTYRALVKLVMGRHNQLRRAAAAEQASPVKVEPTPTAEQESPVKVGSTPTHAPRPRRRRYSAPNIPSSTSVGSTTGSQTLGMRSAGSSPIGYQRQLLPVPSEQGRQLRTTVTPSRPVTRRVYSRRNSYKHFRGAQKLLALDA